MLQEHKAAGTRLACLSAEVSHKICPGQAFLMQCFPTTSSQRSYEDPLSIDAHPLAPWPWFGSSAGAWLMRCDGGAKLETRHKVMASPSWVARSNKPA